MSVLYPKPCQTTFRPVKLSAAEHEWLGCRVRLGATRTGVVTSLAPGAKRFWVLEDGTNTFHSVRLASFDRITPPVTTTGLAAYEGGLL